MLRDPSSSLKKVRVTTAMKARSVDTGDFQWFPEGAVLWHLEIGEEVAHFVEMGGRETYEFPVDEFLQRVKKLSR
jgi:hypothetical protein